MPEESQNPARRRPPPPPKPPMFGVRLHPIVIVLIVALSIAIALLICLGFNPDFLPQMNPFSNLSPQ